jgi:hypothetical protein
MTGVEILAAQEVVTEYAWNWSAYFITIGIVVLCGGFIGLAFSKPLETFQGLVGGVCVGVLFGAIIGVIPASVTLPDEYETHYKVTISDEVAMNDFLEVYEIIDQEGKIYTIREKNTEDN